MQYGGVKKRIENSLLDVGFSIRVLYVHRGKREVDYAKKTT